MIQVESITRNILEFQSQGASDISINIWTNEQILFQISPARDFIKYGLSVNSDKDRAILHFFNKNKTNTLIDSIKFEKDYEVLDLIEFEEPKGVKNYVKNIEHEPKQIAKEILEGIEIYESVEKKSISIEYVEY